MRDKLKVLLNIGIVNFLYKTAKLFYKYVHKCVTAMKAATVWGSWVLNGRSRLYIYLKKQYNISKVRAFMPLRWKHGVKYFTGICNGEEVFIKTPGDINTIKRERVALKAAQTRSEYLKEHTPEMLMVKDTDEILIEKRIAGRRLDKVEKWGDNEEKEAVIRQIFSVYQEMKKNGIIHMDIRPANFIVSHSDGAMKVILIDFGYGLVDSKDVYKYIGSDHGTKFIIKDLGSNYSLKNGTWDDAYSCLMTLKAIEPSLMKDYYEIWRTLNEDIGLNQVKA